MRYEHIVTGTFINRPNRFIAHVMISEPGGPREIVCHVKNTGRCRELLLPGVTVFLQFHPDAALLGRKTEYSLIGVYKVTEDKKVLINMDSQAPNQVADEWLHSMNPKELRPANIRREVTYGQSRFDLAFDSFAGLRQNPVPAFMEVKGVTLEEHSIAMFPDAPTVRGVKHIRELIHAAEEGYEAYILFVIQMKGVREFTPNWRTQPEFGEALREAQGGGVHILAYDCIVTEDTLDIDSPVIVRLSN